MYCLQIKPIIVTFNEKNIQILLIKQEEEIIIINKQINKRKEDNRTRGETQVDEWLEQR